MIRELLGNLNETCDDPASVEILIKVDAEDAASQNAVKTASEASPLNARFLVAPKDDGYYGLHKYYQKLFELTDPDSYFIMLISDEVRFLSKGWDKVLAAYVNHYADDVFRLRLSENKDRQYTCFDECCPFPDNFPIATRRWYQLTGGVGDLYGIDNWHQILEYELGKFPSPDGGKGIHRGVVVDDIPLGGLAASVGEVTEQTYDKIRRFTIKWRDINRRRSHQRFRELAGHLAAEIWAYSNGHTDYKIENDPNSRTLRVNLAEALEPPEPITVLSYTVTRGEYLRECLPRLSGSFYPTRLAWLLGLVIELPAVIRRFLEPLIRWIFLYGSRLWVLIKGNGYRVEDDAIRKQIYIHSATGDLFRVLNYRLIL